MKKLFILCMAALMAIACERATDKDPRTAFVGDYNFVSTGNIDLYADSMKVATLPMDKKGELAISLADTANAVWLVAEGDSTIARVSDNRLFIDPATEKRTFNNLVLNLSYTYSAATLEHDSLSMVTNVEITATYMGRSLSGRGKVDVVATKK
jgi:hypothetical protein